MTPKQAMFVYEYLIDFNATRAAKAAGFGEKGARAQGSRLLTNVNVAAAIAAAKARDAQKFEIKRERTLRKLAEIAYGDAREMLDEDGKLLPVQRMSEAARTMIAGLEVEVSDGPGGGKKVAHKVKIADRLRALEMLGKFDGLFAQDSMSASVTAGAAGLGAGSEITVTLVRPG